MSNIFEQVTKKTTIRTARHEIKTRNNDKRS
jgi:hypothetical protein